MDVIECEGCGGTVVYDAEHEAVRCVFCGGVALQPARLDAPAETAAIAAPWTVDPHEARELYRTWARSSWWYPRALRRLDVDLHEVWIPAWRVEAEVEAHWTGLASAATKSGKRPRAGTDFATRRTWIPASLGLTQDELGALAPFDEDASVPWTPDDASAPFEVLGLSAASAVRAARPRFSRAARTDVVRRTRVCDCRVSTVLHDLETRALMLPVFIGCFRFREQPWRFVINAQTGRITGRAPLDRAKVGIAIVGAALVAIALAWWQSR